MTRDSTLGRAAIREQFTALAELLDDPLTVYLIGGGAMTLQELKDATKDIDLIVETEEELERIRDSLLTAGYEFPDDIEIEYEKLEAAFILEKRKRRFDVFNRQVAGELVLTDSMKERSSELFEDGLLSVRIVSLNDIFLFKSVANREDDVEDMIVLAQTGLDINIIRTEILEQFAQLGEDQFINSIKKKLSRLEDRGYSLDIQSEINDLVDRVNRASRAYNWLHSTYDREYRHDDLYDGVPESRFEGYLDDMEEPEEVIDWLKTRGDIRVADDGSFVPYEE